MNNIKVSKGNIFTSNCQTLVNTVNCVGVMGAGIALEFKLRYPKMYNEYVKHCNNKLIEVGKLWIYNAHETNNKVMNFPTKVHWRNPSKYDYLEKGLFRFVETYNERGITSVAFPLLGALNGGLDPVRVLDIMRSYLSKCDIPVEIYEYDSSAQDELIEAFRAKMLTMRLDELEKTTFLKMPYLLRIIEVLRGTEIRSMIQLNKIKGISENTVQLCYDFAMKNIKKRRYDEKNQPLDLFPNDLGNGAFNKQELVKKEISLENKKPSVRRRKRKDLLQTTVEEKALLTGLQKAVVLSIEEKEEDKFTVLELKKYCDGLHIDAVKFFKENFIRK